MFGTYRLILAAGVVLAHMGVSVWGIHTGIVGVVCFYMVSGYAMTGLIRSAYPKPTRDAPAFYLDRLIRLGPQYYFYIAICAFTVLVLNWRESPAQDGSPDALNIFANLTIIPLAFWMYSDSIRHLGLNMPTWSLGLEFLFYLLLPWLLWDRRTLWAAAGVAAIVWTLATQGVINPDYYAYRMLPGTLVFFLVGVAVQRRDWWLFGLLATFFLASYGALAAVGKIWLMFNAHLLVGAALGCVTVPLLAMLRRNRFDDLLGGVSYGTYLAHWIFVTVLKHHYGQAWAVSVAILGSMACGWLTYRFVEVPTIRYRRALRSRKLARLPQVVAGAAVSG